MTRNQDENDAANTIVTCLAITAVGIIFTMVAINVSALQVSKHYVQEAKEYISETLTESYDVTIADNNAEKLAQAVYGAIESNNDIIKSGRTAHDPIVVTTDEGTLITIAPIVSTHRQPKESPMTYTLLAYSYRRTERICISGSFDQLCDELFNFAPPMTATPFVFEENGTYHYFDGTNSQTPRPQRREDLLAYAHMCLNLDSPEHVDIRPTLNLSVAQARIAPMNHKRQRLFVHLESGLFVPETTNFVPLRALVMIDALEVDDVYMLKLTVAKGQRFPLTLNAQVALDVLGEKISYTAYEALKASSYGDSAPVSPGDWANLLSSLNAQHESKNSASKIYGIWAVEDFED